MGTIFEDLEHIQREMKRVGIKTTRKPNEADHTFVDQVIAEEPLEAARMMYGPGLLSRNPPCECVQCLQQFRTAADQKKPQFLYTKTISWKDAQKKCNAWVEEITSSQIYLQDVISKHGNTIVNRWKKKSVAKRAALLKEIFPDMSSRTHEMFDVNYVARFYEARAKQRNSYLATCLTIDQLASELLRLLSLLHARTRYDPEEWVAWDSTQFHIGWITGKLAVEHCNASVVMYGSKYGQVVQWKEYQAHSWITIGYPRAQLVLESQALVMGTL
jgi:hypothetical protein